jgi:hypothetical protein
VRLDQEFPQRAVAVLAGLPRGSISAWQHQSKLPSGRRYDLADVMSLKAATELTELGLELAAAAELAWKIKSDWVDVASHEAPVYLVVWPAPPGATVAYQYALQNPEQTMDTLVRMRGVRLIRLDLVAREVLTAAAELAKHPARRPGRPRSRP